MDRIKKTAREIEQIIRAATPDLKDVQFQVHAEKSVSGWGASAVVGIGNIIEVNAHPKRSWTSLSCCMNCNKNNKQ